MNIATSSRVTIYGILRPTYRSSYRNVGNCISCNIYHRRGLASDAYFPNRSPIPPNAATSSGPGASTSSNGSGSTKGKDVDMRSTTETPELDPKQRQLIESIIRVDQAGEVGANWIYRGQKLAMTIKGDKKSARQIEEMWENERHHLKTMDLLRKQHNVRPTALYPLWQCLALGLGTVTGLMGREAAMACTEAVETVIGEHYDDQLRALKPMLSQDLSSSLSSELSDETNFLGSGIHPSLPLLRNVLTEFRDDELEHLDTAVEEGAQKAPGHSLLSAVIGIGCKGAIKVCERV